jgi:predicted protein tyrosine phosphatase
MPRKKKRTAKKAVARPTRHTTTRRQRPIYNAYAEQTIVAADGRRSIVPVVKNECEAEILRSEFDALLTAGPPAHEVQWDHANHRVVPFADYHDFGPTPDVMDRIMEFGLANADRSLLVHCHAGMSRSPAAAVAILCARGVDPEQALVVLRDAHPPNREFTPNRLAVQITADLLGLPDLPEIARAHEVWPTPIKWDHRDPWPTGDDALWDDPFDTDPQEALRGFSI